MKIPLSGNKISAGFPSPAEDFIEKHLSLDELLVPHPAATFFIKVQGESMKNAGIQNGDILIVDRSIEPRSGHIVVAVLNDEFLVKRFKKIGTTVWLYPENQNFKPLQIHEGNNFEIWGVVSSCIHQFT